MGSPKGEVRPFVIEGLISDRGDMFRSAFVFRVTNSTLPLFLESSMRSLFLLDVLAHLLVAIETECGLRGFVEPFVTLGTIFLPFCMSLNYLARHESSLNGIGSDLRREEHQQTE